MSLISMVVFRFDPRTNRLSVRYCGDKWFGDLDGLPACSPPLLPEVFPSLIVLFMLALLSFVLLELLTTLTELVLLLLLATLFAWLMTPFGIYGILLDEEFVFFF